MYNGFVKFRMYSGALPETITGVADKDPGIYIRPHKAVRFSYTFTIRNALVRPSKLFVALP